METLSTSPCVLFTEQYMTIQSYKFPWNLHLRAWNEDNEENNNFFFHISLVTNQRALPFIAQEQQIIFDRFCYTFSSKNFCVASIESAA